jgi:hypothetical protein
MERVLNKFQLQENSQHKKNSISEKDLPTDIILRRRCRHSNPGRLGAGLPPASASQSTRESVTEKSQHSFASCLDHHLSYGILTKKEKQ